MFYDIFFYCTIISILSQTLCCGLTTFGDSCDYFDDYVVSRKQWGAKDPSSPIDCLWRPAKYLVIHHTYSTTCNTDDCCEDAVKSIQKEHMEGKKWPDIGYHFIICGNGKSYAGRPWYQIGGHTKNHNRKSIGVAFLGDFSTTVPGPEMLDIVPRLAACGVQKGYIDEGFLVIGHKDAVCSPCPGKALYEIVKTWSRFPKKVPIPSFYCDAAATTTITSTDITSEPETTEVTTASSTSPPTTESTESTVPTPTTTTENTVTTTEETKPTTKAIPVYYYVLLSKKAIPPDALIKLAY